MIGDAVIAVAIIVVSAGFGATAAGAFYLLDRWRMRFRG